MATSTNSKQYDLKSPFESYFQILFYLVMVFVIFLLSRNSEDWLSFRLILLVIPGIHIKVLSLVFFSRKITISNDSISSTSCLKKIELPGEMIAKINYKPGGYGKGITIPGTIIIYGENDTKKIIIHSFMKKFKEFEERMINLLSKYSVADYRKVKDDAINSQNFALIPREFILEIFIYTLVTISSMYICIGTIIK